MSRGVRGLFLLGLCLRVLVLDSALSLAAGSTPFLVSTLESGQSQPYLAYNAESGQNLICWVDDRNLRLNIPAARISDQDIFCRFFDGFLNPLGSEFPAVAEEGRQTHPVLMAEGLEFRLIWANNAKLSIESRQIGKFLSATGNGFTNDKILVSWPWGEEIHNLYPAVAGNSDDKQLVVWQHRGFDYQILGRLFTQQEEDTHLTISNGGWDQLPAVAYSPDADRFLVVWMEDPTWTMDGLRAGISARFVSGAGEFLAEQFTIAAEGNCLYPKVSYNPATQEFWVIWVQAQGFNPGGQILLQKIPATLGDHRVGSQPPILVSSGYFQNKPALSIRVDGLGLVVWEDRRNPDNFDLLGRFLGANGEAQGEIFMVAGESNFDEMVAQVVSDGKSFLIVHQEGTFNTNHSRVWVQQIIPPGSFTKGRCDFCPPLD